MPQIFVKRCYISKMGTGFKVRMGALMSNLVYWIYHWSRLLKKFQVRLCCKNGFLGLLENYYTNLVSRLFSTSNDVWSWNFLCWLCFSSSFFKSKFRALHPTFLNKKKDTFGTSHIASHCKTFTFILRT